KLWVTVYQEDDEAYEIWSKEVGVPADRIIRIGDNKGARYASDNFWQMADTGPCGPCTEIFYDHGPDIWGGPPGSPEEDGDRYIEIWNLVFMQYNRDENGVLHPLPRPCVDTGMGLERIAAVLQHVHSNYEIDLFQNLIAAAQKAVHVAGGEATIDAASLKVIADHIRACAFLIVDGVIPGNEGRGYVLRRIVRRAIRHGYKLGARTPFFNTLVAALVGEMGEAYPELARAEQRVTDILRLEEERFFETIAHGMDILDGALTSLPKGGVLDGETAFKLHDTYGFPLDLTADVCRERDLNVDEAGFDAAMTRQREQARAAGKFQMTAALSYDGPATTFEGYALLATESTIIALYKDGAAVNSLAAGETGVVVLDKTPFYAESGGQVGDNGVLTSVHGEFLVEDTQKIQAQVFGHYGTLRQGSLSVGNTVDACVNVLDRERIVRNHSATHLMHKALREVLGDHVQQKGSLVDPEKTRFDFAHNAPMTLEQICAVEDIVNREIMRNLPTDAREMAIEDAQKLGAMMLFGEKYGDKVRVLDIGTSRELCGGTHVSRTGDIGLFTILSESGVAAGVRRVEALTGDYALAAVQFRRQALNEVAGLVKCKPAELPTRVNALIEGQKAQEKEINRLQSKLAAAQGGDLVSKAEQVNGVAVLAVKLEGVSGAGLRETLDQLKTQLKSGVIVLGVAEGDKVSLIAGVTPDLVGRFKAGELVNHVASQVGGKGGGRPDMAQAGGTQPANLANALASVSAWVAGR
ncbi:MAG: alanine--tRNA ligase, partial [Fluviibacter sp.]